MNQLFLFRKNMTPIRKLLLMKMFAGGVPISEYTATGNPLTFNTNVAKPLKSLVLPWTPVQSGTGDPSPSNVRSISGVSVVNLWQTGKNLLNPAKKNISYANNIYYYKEEGLYLPAGKYTLSIDVECSRIVVDFLTNENIKTTYNSSPNTFTLAEGKKVYFNFYKSGGIDHDANGMLEVGESASDYSPYTGTTKSIVFPALGKNLLPPLVKGDGVNSTTGASESNNNMASSGFSAVSFADNANYYMSGIVNLIPSYISAYNADKEFLGRTTGTTRSNQLLTKDSFTAGTPQGTGEIAFVRLTQYIGSSGYSLDVVDGATIQLEVGSTATTYEPYTSTVYCGSLDLVSGVLTAEWAEQILDGTDGYNWSYAAQTSTSRFSITTSVFKNGKAKDSGDCLFNYFNFSTSSSEWNGRIGNTGNLLLYVPSSITTREELRSYFSEHTLQVVYRLETAKTWQLDAHTIQTIIGDNVLWSDTNGTNTAIYFKKG